MGIPYCIGCSPGQYQDQEGKNTCKDCEINFVSEAANAKICTPCVEGTGTALNGTARCSSCSVGQSGSGAGGKCALCAKGTYRSGAMTDAVAFPDYILKCKPCEKGKYQNQEGQALCLPCVPGQYQDQEGKKSCIKCASGRQFNATIGGSSASNCVACVEGQYQPKEESTFCLPCLTGTFQNASGSSSCNDCPIGFNNGDTKKISCSECKAGKFQDAIQQANCEGMFYVFCKRMDLMALTN